MAKRFRVFDAAATPGFDSNNILSLYESRSGVLWIGTVASGLFRLDNGVATTYTDRDGLPSRLVNSIRGDAGGRLWINTSQGVARFDGAQVGSPPHSQGESGQGVLLAGAGWKHVVPLGSDVVRFGADGSIATLHVRKPSAFLVHEARDGSVWIAVRDEYRLVRYYQGVFSDVPLPPARQPANGRPSPREMCSPWRRTRMGNCCCSHLPDSFGPWTGRLSPPEPLPLALQYRRLTQGAQHSWWIAKATAGWERLRQGCFASGQPR